MIDQKQKREINPLKYHHISCEGLYNKTREILKQYDVTMSKRKSLKLKKESGIDYYFKYDLRSSNGF